MSLAILTPFNNKTISVNHVHEAVANLSSNSNITCPSGIHIIVGRASTEASGEGIIGTVATKIQQHFKASLILEALLPISDILRVFNSLACVESRLLTRHCHNSKFYAVRLC
jgi:hypothetical protein